MSKRIKIVVFLLVAILVIAPVFLKKEKASISIADVANRLGIKTTLIAAKNRKISFVNLAFRNAGVLQNSLEKHGVSVLAGHLLYRIGGLSLKDTDEKLMQLGIGDAKWSTDGDDLMFSFYVANDRINDACCFLSTLFKNPTITEGDLKQAKSKLPINVSNELSHPSTLLLNRLFSLLYKNSAYGLNRSGSSATMDSITLDDLQQFIRTNLTTKNLKVTIVGDLSRSEIDTLLDILCEHLPRKYSLTVADKLTCSLSETKISEIHKSDMNDIMGFMVGVRLDDLTDLELAAIYIIIGALFENKTGDFFRFLKKQNIACLATCNLMEYRLSCALILEMFFNRADFEKFKKCFYEKFSEYNEKRNITELGQRKRSLITSMRQNGFVNYANINQKLRAHSLPFEKVTEKVVEKVMSKLFDERMRRIVIIKSNN
jgi:predicted Zn-dependent peptidase